jgi:alpha-tubulin suppressor-like RCC1 family protein
MKNTTYSFKPVRVLLMAMLAVQLALNGLSPVQALSTSSLVGWGNNYWGQASIPAGLTDVVAMAGGEAHSLALKGDGAVVGWGHNGFGQTNIPSHLD